MKTAMFEGQRFSISHEGESEDSVRDHWVDALISLRVPPKYRAVKRDTQLPDKLANWNGDPWCVVLLGPTGSGKTWTAVRLLVELYDQDRARFMFSKSKPRFADCSLSIEAMRHEIATPADGSTFRELERADLLLLDDFGAERDGEFQREKVSLVLRSRYNEQRPTIITSNVTSLEPIAAVEPRIASRLAEGIVLILGGRDRRLK